MKTVLITSIFLLGVIVSTKAMEPLAPMQQQNFVCAPLPGNVSRVSTAAIDTKCCSPHTHCVEYLSNTILDHASKANRT
jgi:hypothetical protein